MDMVYRDTPVGFHRLNPGPLDDQEIFTSNADLLDYLKNRTGYHGQRVLLKYGFYDQQCVFKKGKGNTLVPVLELPPGTELIFKLYNNKHYVLVWYFNDDTGAIPGNRQDKMICFGKPYYFSMLPQCSLFANTNDNINYLLEVNDEVTPLTQGNPMDVVSSESLRSVMDRGLENMTSGNIVRLWVECDDYYKAVGV